MKPKLVIYLQDALDKLGAAEAAIATVEREDDGDDVLYWERMREKLLGIMADVQNELYEASVSVKSGNKIGDADD
jgi:hypothetical protein